MFLLNAQETPLKWDKQGVPHSIVFNDKYFCTENGYAEAIHVSCKGNQLQERFTALDPGTKGTFTIIETGFGTALSFCCAWQMWQWYAPSSWKLHYISIDLYPVSKEDLSRALALWPNLAIFKQALAEQYGPSRSGIKDFYFNRHSVRLTLVFEHVVLALKQIKDRGVTQKADAWFLNGFAPFKNPHMWSDEVFAAMAPLSAAGTTLSTFTVAGLVRRGLQAQGFEVRKIAGFGKKKHILAGEFIRQDQ